MQHSRHNKYLKMVRIQHLITTGVFSLTGLSIEITIYNNYRKIIEAKEPWIMALTSIYFWGSNDQNVFLLGFPFRSSRLSSTPHHSGQRCHFHIHHHKFHVCFFPLISSLILFVIKTVWPPQQSSFRPLPLTLTPTLTRKILFTFFAVHYFLLQKSLLQWSNWKHIVLGVNRLNIHVYTKLLLT